MPLIKSEYKSPIFFSNGHIQTIHANIFRWVKEPPYKRKRISTPDGDFLDLDISKVGSKKLAILSHGLGADSYRPYITGMVHALNKKGFDALAWNFRGFSGVPNKTAKMTHAGATHDLEAVIQYALSLKKYKAIVLVGFSLGGNITLKYLGEQGKAIHPQIVKAITYSVPCNLHSSAQHIGKFSNKIYMLHFMMLLRNYIHAKTKILPGEIDASDLQEISNFKQFDNRYVAPLHGFKDAEDYWKQSSCDRYLENIKVPTLLVNAKDDPFLPGDCFPIKQSKNNPNLTLEIPQKGGHVGFVSLNWSNEYWSEKRALDFIQNSD